MARVDEDFWYSDRNPAAKPEEVNDAERYVGHRLPEKFRQLLYIQNGGVADYSAFENGGEYFPLLPFFGVNKEVAAGSIMRAFDVREHFGAPDGVVPFAGQGEAWFGFDYRQGEEPVILYRDSLESDIETVAASFDEFLEHLIEE